MFGLVLDPHVKITDLITCLSVICAASTLIYTWTKDRHLRSREYADKVRSAAALTLSKVDRCQMILLSIGRLVQGPITEADELIVKTKSVVACRDTLWKTMHLIRSNIMKTIEDEDLETAYAPLYVYRQDVYFRFKRAISAVMALESSAFWRLQELCQETILAMPSEGLRPALTGNKLRQIVALFESEYQNLIREALGDLKGFLRDAVSGDDREILASGASEIVDPPEEQTKRTYWEKRWSLDRSVSIGAHQQCAACGR